jgi:hypothetical protein
VRCPMMDPDDDARSAALAEVPPVRVPTADLVLPSPRQLQAIADRSMALLRISWGLYGPGLRRAIDVDGSRCHKALRVCRVWGCYPAMLGIDREVGKIAGQLGIAT